MVNMAKEVRLKLSENEKMGLREGLNVQSFNGDTIEQMVEKENARKFNDQVAVYEEKMEQHNKELEEIQDKLDFTNVEIKPMFSRILVKPFKINPFQKMKVEGNLIVDAGGYTPHIQLNQQSGRYEEQEQFIVTGCVIEVGPETKYLKEGDVIYYRKDTAVPVPFLKEGLVSLAESQIIAVINEGLEKRFKNGK